MPRHTSLSPLKPISEINLTPLMDLTFILLITFIITFPLIEQGIPVNLPRGEAQEIDADSTRTVTVDKAGDLFLDDLPTDEEALLANLTELARSFPDIAVLVRADEELQYKRVVEVMRILHQARISRMALVTRADESPVSSNGDRR